MTYACASVASAKGKALPQVPLKLPAFLPRQAGDALKTVPDHLARVHDYRVVGGDCSASLCVFGLEACDRVRTPQGTMAATGAYFLEFLPEATNAKPLVELADRHSLALNFRRSDRYGGPSDMSVIQPEVLADATSHDRYFAQSDVLHALLLSRISHLPSDQRPIVTALFAGHLQFYGFSDGHDWRRNIYFNAYVRSERGGASASLFKLFSSTGEHQGPSDKSLRRASPLREDASVKLVLDYLAAHLFKEMGQASKVRELIIARH